MSESHDNGDYWNALYWVGWILLASALLPGIVVAIFAAITNTNVRADGGAYAVGSMVLAGLAIMVYTSTKMARKNSSTKK